MVATLFCEIGGGRTVVHIGASAVESDIPDMPVAVVATVAGVVGPEKSV